jgi:CDP-diacylglycerol--serine O-phosphatidyltransferase
MNKIETKYIWPNAITATNMLLGFLSITMSIKGNLNLAAWLILLAMIFDGLDGMTARKLNAFSEFGKEFDSFCDAISFGVAPGILIFSLLSEFPGIPKELIAPLAFIYSLAGVVRLVKFNVVTTASDSKDDFSGMPIPNGANIVVSYYLFAQATGLGLNPKFLAIIALIAAVLMVSTIPFKIPQKVFSFIPKKGIFPFAIFVFATAEYSLFPLGAYYILANLFTAFSHKEDY